MRRSERGSATVVATACLGVLMLLGAALGVVAAMVVAHRASQAAADLAALAGAVAAGEGQDPCAAAADIAEANGATITNCQVDGTEVTIEVVTPGPRWLGQSADLTGKGRAGPVPP